MRLSSRMSASRRRSSGGGGGSGFTTFSPNYKSDYVTLSSDKLTATNPTPVMATMPVFSIDAKVTGKFYHEVTVGSTGSISIMGVMEAANADLSGGSALGDAGGAHGYILYSDGNAKIAAGGGTAGAGAGFSYTAGDVIGFETDLDGSTIRLRKNGGAWTSTVPLTPGIAYSPFVSPSGGSGANMTVNFGASAWADEPSAGFGGWTRNESYAGRYFRIRQHSGSRESVFVLGEFELRESTGGASIFTGGTASAQSEYDGSFLAGNACDGNATTSWSSTYGGGAGNMASWWQYDLGVGVTKSPIEAMIASRADYPDYPTAFAISYSLDGTAWLPLFAVQHVPWAQATKRTFGFDPTADSYVGPKLPAAPAAITGDKWRIRYVTNGGGSGNASADEIDMAATFGGADQCSGGTAIASSEFSGTYAAAYAFDASSANFWVSAGGMPGAWIGYDFGAPTVVKEIKLLPRPSLPNEAPWSGYADYWDGAAWQVAWWLEPGAWADGVTKTLRQPATGSRWRVRVVYSSTGSNPGFAEVKMRTSPGGADQCSGGNPISSPSYSSGYYPTNGYDGNTATEWAAINGGPTGGNGDQWIGYDFFDQKEIVEFELTARSDGAASGFQLAFERYNPAADLWETVWTEVTSNFTSNEVKTFTRPKA
ncbi:MAG TPA: discoidin domain-containing protein [Rhizobium sp.]|nr:discoidin domain-containing protein [Rhizobium sp.]